MKSSKNQDLKDLEIVENSNIKKIFTDETGGKIPYNERIKINFHLLEKIRVPGDACRRDIGAHAASTRGYLRYINSIYMS